MTIVTNHNDWKHGFTLVCIICGKLLYSFNILMNHNDFQLCAFLSNALLKLLMCIICGKLFNYTTTVKKHNNSKHVLVCVEVVTNCFSFWQLSWITMIESMASLWCVLFVENFLYSFNILLNHNDFQPCAFLINAL